MTGGIRKSMMQWSRADFAGSIRIGLPKTMPSQLSGVCGNTKADWTYGVTTAMISAIASLRMRVTRKAEKIDGIASVYGIDV